MSIGDRIRPNSEAAPWVIEEVRKLEAEVERLRGIVEVNDQRLAVVWDEARAEVKRLKAQTLPCPFHSDGKHRCIGCGDIEEAS